MKFRRKIYVVGGAHTPFVGKHSPDFIWKGHPDFGKRENPTLEELIHQVVHSALESTGVKPADIEKIYIGNFVGELFSNQGHLGSMVARVHPDLETKPIARTEAACASGGIAITAAIDALNAGHDIAMALGAEVQTTASARDGADYLARAAHYASERGIDDFTFPCLFARRAKAYKEATGATDEDIAHVVAKAYENGNRNPFAHMRTVKVSVEHAATASDKNPNFLKNPEYKEHLKITDCSQVSDGASAILLATEEGLEKLGIDKNACVEILAYAQATSALGAVKDLTRLDNAAAAAERAYADAGLTPADVQVAEVHDCFAITELMMYEALGFAEYGQGGALARSGATRLDGSIPVNTGGGLMAFGHPVGATGVKQVLEIYRQMKGLCGDYQIATPPMVGLTANMGGDDRTTVVMLMRNVA